MTDHHDQQLRELTYKLMHMAPDAPPFPETPMTTLAPQRTPERQDIPPRKRTWSGPAVAAGAFAVVLLIAVPAMLLGRSDTTPIPPATNPSVTTTPPTTQPPATTPPTTKPPTSSTVPASRPPAGAISDLSAGLPGGAPLDGSTVVASPLLITGLIDGATEVTVNGTTVAAPDGFFEATVNLTPGDNDVSIGDGPTASVSTVAYIPDGTVEFAYLTKVTAGEVIADYAQWLTGDEANQAAIEDGEIAAGDTVPNDYYIRNQNPQLRTLPLAEDVAVMLPTPAFDSVEVIPVTIADWLALFKEDGTPWNPETGDEPPPSVYEGPHAGYFGAGDVGAGYWLTLDADGTVVQVVAQYRP